MRRPRAAMREDTLDARDRGILQTHGTGWGTRSHSWVRRKGALGAGRAHFGRSQGKTCTHLTLGQGARRSSTIEEAGHTHGAAKAASLGS